MTLRTMASCLLSAGAVYLVHLGLGRVRRWKAQRELQMIDGLIAAKGQQARFAGFDPDLRERSARRRALADVARRDVNRLNSGGETTTIARKLRQVS